MQKQEYVKHYTRGNTLSDKFIKHSIELKTFFMLKKCCTKSFKTLLKKEKASNKNPVSLHCEYHD